MTHEELILKAKGAKSAEEILSFAKENGMELTEESAKSYFEQLHKTGELSDEELDNVSGGICKNGGKYVVIATMHCEQWKCEKCGGHCYDTYIFEQAELHDCKSTGNTMLAVCNNCAYCTYERGLWLCSNADFWENRKLII